MQNFFPLSSSLDLLLARLDSEIKQNPEAEGKEEDIKMHKLISALKIHVIKGTHLVVKDTTASDPYVLISMASQKVKTRAVQNNCNPVWNDAVTLAVEDLNAPIKLSVLDKDTFTGDDHMGDANIDIKPYVEHLRASLAHADAHHPDGHVVHMVIPNRENCLAESSPIVWKKGKLVYDMVLRLTNVASGEVHIQLEWVHVTGCIGLAS